MKIMGVGENGQAELVEVNPDALKGRNNKIICKTTFKRIKHAFIDWEWACEQGERYANLRQQDFEHGLIAIDDLFTQLKRASLTESERNELTRFVQSLKA